MVRRAAMLTLALVAFVLAAATSHASTRCEDEPFGQDALVEVGPGGIAFAGADLGAQDAAVCAGGSSTLGPAQGARTISLTTTDSDPASAGATVALRMCSAPTRTSPCTSVDLLGPTGGEAGSTSPAVALGENGVVSAGATLTPCLVAHGSTLHCPAGTGGVVAIANGDLPRAEQRQGCAIATSAGCAVGAFAIIAFGDAGRPLVSASVTGAPPVEAGTTGRTCVASVGSAC